MQLANCESLGSFAQIFLVRSYRVFKAMTAEEYLTQRVDQFQGWYDKKAVTAKTRYLNGRVISVVGAALVPVVVNIAPEHYADIGRYATTLIGLVVTITVGLESVFHYGDQWKNYRSTEQFLSREKFLFRTGEGVYRDLDAEKAFIVFVERCEAQIAAENSATLNVIATAAQQAETVKA